MNKTTINEYANETFKGHWCHRSVLIIQKIVRTNKEGELHLQTYIQKSPKISFLSFDQQNNVLKQK